MNLNGKVGFINKEGVLVIQNKYYWAESFENGSALVHINKDVICNALATVLTLN